MTRDDLIKAAAAVLAERVNPNCPWPEKAPEDAAVYRSDAAAMLDAVLPLIADEIAGLVIPAAAAYGDGWNSAARGIAALVRSPVHTEGDR